MYNVCTLVSYDDEFATIEQMNTFVYEQELCVGSIKLSLGYHHRNLFCIDIEKRKTENLKIGHSASCKNKIDTR